MWAGRITIIFKLEQNETLCTRVSPEVCQHKSGPEILHQSQAVTKTKGFEVGMLKISGGPETTVKERKSQRVAAGT